MKAKSRVSFTLLLFFMIMENLCLFYFHRQGMWSTGKNAICLFLCSVLFGVVFVWRFYSSSLSVPVVERKYRWLTWASVVGLMVGLVAISFDYNTLFKERVISPNVSDVIPMLQVACRRFLAGEYPYTPVTEFGWREDMTCLPVRWMPLCLAPIFNMDPRWISQGLWAIAAVILCVRSGKVSNPVVRATIPVLLYLSNAVLFYNNNTIVTDTVEFMIAAYYMWLITSFNTTNGWLQGFVIGCCLLSRYSLLLWLPLYAVALFVNGQRRQLYIATGTAMAMVLLLYVLPFMTKDPGIFTNSYKYYSAAAEYEWHRKDDNGQAIHLFKGTGFAYWFYTRFADRSIGERLQLLQRTHIIACLAITGIMTLWYVRYRSKIDNRIFLMGSFKIYLAVFLFLIQVPYEYLMCVGNFVSVAMFCEQARYHLLPAAKNS